MSSHCLVSSVASLAFSAPLDAASVPLDAVSLAFSAPLDAASVTLDTGLDAADLEAAGLEAAGLDAAGFDASLGGLLLAFSAPPVAVLAPLDAASWALPAPLVTAFVPVDAALCTPEDACWAPDETVSVTPPATPLSEFIFSLLSVVGRESSSASGGLSSTGNGLFSTGVLSILVGIGLLLGSIGFSE